MSQYILIENGAENIRFSLDTPQQIEAALAALRGAGIAEAKIHADDPDCPDNYSTGSVLHAPPHFAAIGTDGMREIVWGLGPTEELAVAEAIRPSE